MPHDSGDYFEQLSSLVGEVKTNFKDIIKDWTDVKNACTLETLQETQDYVIVSREEFGKLLRESEQLKQHCRTLCKVTLECRAVASAKITELTQALEQSKKHIEDLQGEISHWQTKVDNLSSEYMKEKEENIHLKCVIQEVSQQLQLQSDYLVHLGASSCTLLWRVSRCEESIEAIIGGTKVDDFLSLVSTTLNSFLQTYDNPEEDTDSEETQFILALCGTITNIAASALGREFLMTNQNGHLVMDTFLHALSELKLGQCTKMKQLILMCMYNVSINQKGGRHIINHPGIIGLLIWLLQGEKASDIVLQLIRLIHSLICEQGNPKILHEVNEVLSDQLVQQLAADRNKEISQAAIEMMSDIRVLKFPALEQCRDMR